MKKKEMKHKDCCCGVYFTANKRENSRRCPRDSRSLKNDSYAVQRRNNVTFQIYEFDAETVFFTVLRHNCHRKRLHFIPLEFRW